MSGFGNITKKAAEFLNSDKGKEALRSEQAENVSDGLLGGAAGTVNKVTGDKFEDRIEGARAAADKRIGTDS